MFVIGLVIFLLIFSGSCEPSCEFGVVVRWAKAEHPSVMPTLEPDPVGWDNGGSVFLGRSYIKEYHWWKPGSIFVRDDDVSCQVHQHQAFSKDAFQVFNAPRGTTSWIPYNPSNPPSATAIVAGWHNNDPKDAAYICRAWVGGNLLVGNVGLGSSTCWISTGDQATAATALEIFTLNHYGLLTAKYRCHIPGTRRFVSTSEEYY